jgi:hypothetical protein
MKLRRVASVRMVLAPGSLQSAKNLAKAIAWADFVSVARDDIFTTVADREEGKEKRWLWAAGAYIRGWQQRRMHNDVW